jgi:DNA-binding protein YbaB
MDVHEARQQELLDLARQQMEKAEQMQTALADLQAVGRGGDGHVEVTVGQGGTIVDIQLDPRVMRYDSTFIRDGLMEAYQDAMAQVRAQMQEIIAPVLGDSGITFDDLASGHVDFNRALERQGASIEHLEREMFRRD